MTKMSKKQSTVGEFDLKSFLGKADGNTEEQAEPSAKPTAAKSKPVPKPKKVATKRPPVYTELVQFKTTADQKKKLEGKAGDVPLSVYIRKELEKIGLL